MDAIDWLALAALALASYFATIHLALIELSQSAFHRLMAARGRSEHGGWLLARRHAALLAASFLRTTSRVAFVVMVLVSVVGVGEDAAMTTGRLIVCGTIAVAGLWFFSSVLAAIVARHAGAELVVASMLLLRLLALIGTPVDRAFGFLDEIVRRLTGATGETTGIAEAELLRQIEDSQLRGALDAEAAELLENVVEFRTTDVGAVMTPRTDIEGIELTDDLGDIRKFIVEAGYSRIPVYQENLDHIVGILYVKDLVPFLGQDASTFKLRPLLRQPIWVPETKPVGELLADFQKAEVHMAIVIDEYGGTSGLATIEDVLEELVGEIQDEHDQEDEEAPSLKTLAEGRAEVDGRYHIDDLNEELGLELPEDDEFDTVGGFVLASLGRVPKVGESFESHNARFTALAATPTHVRRIGIELLTPVRANGENGRNGV